MTYPNITFSFPLSKCIYTFFFYLYTVLFSLSGSADQHFGVELRCSFTQCGTVMTVAIMTVGGKCCTITAWFYSVPSPNDKMTFRLHTHPEWRLYQVAHVSYHHRSHRHEDSWSIQVSWPSSPALLSQLLDKNPTWAGIGPNTSCRLTAWHYRSCPCWTWCRVVMLGRASSSWWHFRNPSSKHLVFKHNCVLHGE